MVLGSLTWFSAVISSRKLPGASWIRQKSITTTPSISGTAWISRRRRSLSAASRREFIVLPRHTGEDTGGGEPQRRDCLPPPPLRGTSPVRRGRTSGKPYVVP